MSAEVKLYRQALIPMNELSLLKMTRSTEIPWVDPVTFWVPRRVDVQAIAAIARSVSTNPLVVDIGCGNAFFTHLLAEEMPLIGIDPNADLLEKTPYKHPNLRLISGTADEVSKILNGGSVDVVINSWMPHSIDFSDSLYALKPRIVVFVRDGLGSTGKRESYEPRADYYTAAKWLGVATCDLGSFFDALCHGLEPNLSFSYFSVDQALSHPNWDYAKLQAHVRRMCGRSGYSSGFGVRNVFDIRIRNDVEPPQFPINVPEEQRFPWEEDLNRILAENSLVKPYSLSKLTLEPPVKQICKV